LGSIGAIGAGLLRLIGGQISHFGLCGINTMCIYAVYVILIIIEAKDSGQDCLICWRADLLAKLGLNWGICPWVD
jgi:hypothetical protein